MNKDITIKCCECNKEYEHYDCVQFGYESISICPYCGSRNVIEK